MISCMLFLIDFLLILGASWVDFWKSCWHSKSIKFEGKSVFNKILKTAISRGLFVEIKGSRGPTSSKNQSKNDQKIIQNWSSSYSASWRPTWLPKASQNASKIDAKSMKNGHRNRSKFCMLFEWPFSGS